MVKQENTDLSSVNEKQPISNWSGWDKFLIVTMVLLFLLLPCGGLFYLFGRYSPYLKISMIIIFPVIGVFILVCLLASIVRLFCGWKKYAQKKKLLLVTEICLLIVFIVPLVIPFVPENSVMYWSNYVSFTYGFRERMRSRINVEDVRDWLRTQNSEDFFSYYSELLPPGILPEFLEILKARGISLSADENGNSRIRMDWGSGVLRSWGIVIGMEDMEVPPSQIELYGIYILPLEPGVYVWHELR